MYSLAKRGSIRGLKHAADTLVMDNKPHQGANDVSFL